MEYIYDFTTHTMMPVALESLTDAEAGALLPQHPVVQSLYRIKRAQGYSILEALADLLTLVLQSGHPVRAVSYGG